MAKNKRLDDLVLEDVIGSKPEYIIAKEASKARMLLETIDDSIASLDLGNIEKLKGDQGEKGSDGETPIKGVDYFTEDEIAEIVEAIREDVTDGATPVKGVDYFTDAEISTLKKEISAETLNEQQVVDFINSKTEVIKPEAVKGLNTLMEQSFETKLSKELKDPKSKFRIPYSKLDNVPYYQVGGVGGGSGASPLTTKGDLFTYSTTNTRLPVGANGQTLIADSTQPEGIKWGYTDFFGTGTLAILDYLTTYTPATPTLSAGLQIQFTPDVNNPANATLNGVLIKKPTPTGIQNLEINDLTAGGIYDLTYNGTFWVVDFSGGKDPYTQTFNATTDWGVAVGGLYTITVLATAHNKTAVKNIVSFENDGTYKTLVRPDASRILISNQEVSIQVSETPDGRFAGEINIS